MGSKKALLLIIILSISSIAISLLIIYALPSLLLPTEVIESSSELFSSHLPIYLIAVLAVTTPFLIFFYLLYSRILIPLELVGNISSLVQTDHFKPKEIDSAHPALNEILSVLKRIHEDNREQNIRAEKKLQQASKKLSQERDVLSVIIEHMARGVIVANSAGQILLYNSAAYQLLHQPESDSPSYLGLGRSLDSIFGETLIRYVLDKSLESTDKPVSFLVSPSSSIIIRAEALRTHTNKKNSGLILFLKQANSHSDLNKNQPDDNLRAMRDALGGINGVVENLINYPEMESDKQVTFHKVIADEADKLNKMIAELEEQHSLDKESSAELDLLQSDVLENIIRSLVSSLSPKNQISIFNKDVSKSSFSADGYALAISLFFLLDKIAGSAQKSSIQLLSDNNYLKVILKCKEPLSNSLPIDDWRAEYPEYKSLSLPFSLHEVIESHNAEMWQEENQIVLILPYKKNQSDNENSGFRYTTFDVDLFQNKPTKEISSIPLRKITATVFDTETTGLRPSEGDRLISIGGIRIVNGLPDENDIFHEFINPERPLSKESIAVHGITQDFLKDKPTANSVLKKFHSYCDNSILIAQNAAFDMRFLQIQQKSAEVEFSQPVLDTLLLSTFLHPHLKGHGIDALCERYNITPENRHDALADAIMTMKIFLKMVPLLESKGIDTVGKALKAAQESLYAKLVY